MKKPGKQSSSSPPNQAPLESKGTLDDARELFEELATRAKRQVELEQQTARSESPVTKVLLALTLLACLAAAGTGIYGIYNFPDAPIRQTETGVYVGKGGKSHSRDDYEAFLAWKQAMFIAFPAAFILGAIFGITKAMRRDKEQLSEM